MYEDSPVRVMSGRWYPADELARQGQETTVSGVLVACLPTLLTVGTSQTKSVDDRFEVLFKYLSIQVAIIKAQET